MHLSREITLLGVYSFWRFIVDSFKFSGGDLKSPGGGGGGGTLASQQDVDGLTPVVL